MTSRLDAALRGLGDELLLLRAQDGGLLLADRVAQGVRLGAREAAQGDGRGHDVLLVDEDPVGLLQVRLEQRMEVGRPAPGRACAGCRPGCCPSGPGGRARPWPRGRRPTSGAAPGCSGACPRTRAGTRPSSRPRPAARTSCRRRAGSCRGRSSIARFVVDQVDRLAQDRQVGQAEEVELEQAERLDAVHLVLGHQRVGVGRVLERHELRQRLAADDDARGVRGGVARDALELAGEVDAASRPAVSSSMHAP